MKLTLKSPVETIKGVGEKYRNVLNSKGIYTVYDLLLNFPLYYIDFRQIAQKIEINEIRLYKAELKNFRLTRNFKRKSSLIRVNVTIKKNRVEILFFNQPYLANLLQGKESLLVYGRIDVIQDCYTMRNPKTFIDENVDKTLPVYKKIGMIKSGTITKIITNLFGVLNDCSENLPSVILTKYSLARMIPELKEIHQPEEYNFISLKKLKKRFIYTEFFLYQLELQYIRKKFKNVQRINEYYFSPRIREEINNHLTFNLTAEQISAFSDIVNDFKSRNSMQRLIMGDVGTGKTIIAFLAALIACMNGYQVAFLAPTEVLATQHYLNGTDFFKSFNTGLLTGSVLLSERTEILSKLENGEIDIIFGTHALLAENIKFNKLSMVIIDEQHKFGVAQRSTIYCKGKAVDLLVTTATPIPRTLLLSLYKDLDLSIIKEKPLGQNPVYTSIINYKNRDAFYRDILKRVTKGEKTYIVLPLIEKSDYFSKVFSIEEQGDYYKKIFKNIPLGVLTGKNLYEEKRATLKDFRNGKIRVLISTTVIEVGIDIKDATIMIIENADRYGMAQLHQLRGRVGRGKKDSFCYLIVSESPTSKGKERLSTLASLSDGFKIAEVDLRMRGGGVISGFEQSGSWDFKISDLKRDYRIFKTAQRDVGEGLTDESFLMDPIVADFITKLNKKIKNLSFS